MTHCDDRHCHNCLPRGRDPQTRPRPTRRAGGAVGGALLDVVAAVLGFALAYFALAALGVFVLVALGWLLS